MVLVTGPEELLAERAVASIRDEVRAASPDVEVIRLEAAGYQPGSLSHNCAPSLFGGDKLVVVEGVDEAGEELQVELLAYLAAPEDGATLLVVHRGGQRGRKVLDAMRRAGDRACRVIEAPAMKSDADKSAFVLNEFRIARRRATPEAVRALREAVGKDLRELAAACAQLVADTEGVIDDAMVETYHGGKVEATGFKVADAVLAGQAGEALRLLRHAFATGLDPVPIVAVIAMQLRQLVKVGAAGRGSLASLAKSLGMAPWQVDKARRSLSGWTPDALATSIQAVAAADFEVKGGGRDPQYAVERAILTITRARAAG